MKEEGGDWFTWWPELRYLGGEQREEERVNKIRDNYRTSLQKIRIKGCLLQLKETLGSNIIITR